MDLEKLNNQEYLNEFIKKTDKLEFYNDKNKSFKLLREIKNFIKENKDKIDFNLLQLFKDVIIKLKYILFMSLSEKEIFDLLQNNLVIGIEMTYVELLENLKNRISFLEIEERSEYKKKIIKIISENNEEITNNKILEGKYKGNKTVSSWIFDYNIFLGTEPKNTIEQSKYFVQNKNFSILQKIDKIKLKKLFDIYEYLKRTSFTVGGNEDNDVVEDDNGKIYILKNGKKIEVLSLKDTKKTKKQIGTPQTQEEKNIQELKQEEEKYQPEGLEKLVLEEKIEKEKKIDDLKIEAKKYKDGSLEKMAIEEEINKMRD